MLKPAYLYKDQLEKLFAGVMYDDDYFLYMGYPHGHELPKIEPRDNVYQWVILRETKIYIDPLGIFQELKYIPTKENVIGYFAYQIQPETDTVMNFGLYSFDRGNPLIGHDVYYKMQELAKNHRRIEWRVIGGNPVERHYDKFCYINGGSKVTLHKVVKDVSGVYRDEHIYEIVR